MTSFSFYAIMIIAIIIANVKRKENIFTGGYIIMIDITLLTPEERKIVEARREYQRKWRAANKDKVRKHNKRFYEKVAAENKKSASC